MQINPFRSRFPACLGLVLVLLVAGCEQADSSSGLAEEAYPASTDDAKTAVAQIPYPLPEKYPPPASAVEVMPYPGVNMTDSTPESTWVPTPATPPGPPPIPASWITYTHPTLPLQLRYPPDWAGSPERYEGPDGFFEIRMRTSQPSIFDQIVTLCVLEANGPESGIYGAFPPISDWQGWNPGMKDPSVHGCMVLATQSNNLQPGSQSILFARFPPPWPTDQVLEFRSDAAHFDSFLSSLHLIEYIPPKESDVNTNTPACQEEPGGEPVAVSRFAGLVITETALARTGCDPWANFDGFQNRAEQANQNRSDFKQQGVRLQMESDNQDLAPFGYRLEETTHEPYSFTMFALYQGEILLVDYILRFKPVSVNAAGDDFLLWLGVMSGEPPIVPVEVRRNGLRRLGDLHNRSNSVWIGAEVLSYEIWQNWQLPLVNRILALRLGIKRGEEVISELAIPTSGPVSSAPGIWAWEGHWLLEVDNVLLQDGELLNTQLGYDEIFEWHLVNDRPLYFFRAGLEYGLSYAGQTLPVRYEDVIHSKLWNEAGSYSIISTLLGTDFFARRDGIWYHVTIESEP